MLLVYCLGDILVFNRPGSTIGFILRLMLSCLPRLLPDAWQSFFGISINFPNYSILSIPVTLLWIILVTNSFNLLDNIDGLAGGIAGIAAFMLFISSFGVINHAATGVMNHRYRWDRFSR